ncbi:MAG: hypothetical protein WCH59_09395 [Chitinophagia bacterium]|jgi:Tol biopolymer transport system component
MKKAFLSICLLHMLLTNYAQSFPDSTAIKRVLSKEGLAWRSGNWKLYTECWREQPNNFILVSTGKGAVMEVNPKLILHPNASLPGSGGFSFHTNFLFGIHQNSAWVKHDEVSISKEGIRTFSKELRQLEKKSGQWKLVGQSIHSIPPENKNNLTDTVSYLHVANITSGEIEVVASLQGHFEAPNWHSDNYLIFNSYGRLYTFDLLTQKITPINTDFAIACNNDHGISPDKKMLVISNSNHKDSEMRLNGSAIYTLPINGGVPRLITKQSPSYWHGWSPDGKTLVYCAERNGNYDVYAIPASGGEEIRLTSSSGLDDGPEYAPDGKYIYFNSYQTGRMQIWRMLPDGTRQEQLTFDEYSNWFPHPSPDNKWLVYISYLSDEQQKHLFGRQVRLRLFNLQTKEIKDITPVFFGGQGTINVPSWSADSKKIAFISYSIQ